MAGQHHETIQRLMDLLTGVPMYFLGAFPKFLGQPHLCWLIQDTSVWIGGTPMLEPKALASFVVYCDDTFIPEHLRP